jgi:hypothetical protein
MRQFYVDDFTYPSLRSLSKKNGPELLSSGPFVPVRHLRGEVLQGWRSGLDFDLPRQRGHGDWGCNFEHAV